MLQRDDFLDTPQLDYDAWRVLLRSICGRYSPEGVERKGFAGWVRPKDICGCAAVDLSCNAHRVERTPRDIRLDGMEHYYAVFQLSGWSTMIQNDRVTEVMLPSWIRPGPSPTFLRTDPADGSVCICRVSR
jgi:AraC family transcriptional activator of tynA and feaB